MLARAATFAVAVLAAMLIAVTPGAAQKQGGTLRIYHRDNPPSASLHEEATVSVTQPFMAVFNNLVLFDQTKPLNSLDTIVPDLGESWSWDASKTKLTFKLREGVKWHDGKPFTAKDVQCTWHALIGKDGQEEFNRNPRKVWYYNLEQVTTNGDHEATFHLGHPQPSFLMLLASGFSPVYPCHVSQRDMRTRPIGTGPFKFVELNRNVSIKLVRNPDYWKKGKPYVDAIEMRIIESRSTRILAFVAGEFDMTFDRDITVPLLKDVRAQAPKAICELQPHQRQHQPGRELRRPRRSTIRRSARPWPWRSTARPSSTSSPRARRTWAASCCRRPRGNGRCRPRSWPSCPATAPTSPRTRPRRSKIMERTRLRPGQAPEGEGVGRATSPIYRDPAVILIDQLKKIYIEGELEPIDTTIWYAKVQRKDYSVSLNLTGVAVDDPDVNLIENYTCKSERNYTQYCNPEVDDLIFRQSREIDLRQAQAARVGGGAQAGARRGAAHHLPQQRGHVLAPLRQGRRAAPEQHL